jgi:dephospho-CoA kinase
MLIYGLTGGIGSGKSTVAAMFQKQGFLVFDTDLTGKKLLEPGTETTDHILKRFPKCRLDSNKSKIDRKKLATIVFNDPSQRAWLEEIMHPRIWNKLEQEIEEIPSPRPPACLVEGAVFLESQTDFNLAGMLVVKCPLAQRKTRVQRRDNFSPEQIDARFMAQLPENIKISHATHVIDNGGSLEQTQIQVDQISKQIATEYGEVQ